VNLGDICDINEEQVFVGGARFYLLAPVEENFDI